MATEATHTLFVKDVDRIDSAIWLPNLDIIGKSWHLDLTISGTLDSNGFIYDFSHLKAFAKRTMREHFDHKLIFPSQSTFLRVDKGPTGIQLKDDLFHFRGPAASVCQVETQEISLSLIEAMMETSILQGLPAEVSGIKVHLRSEKYEEDSHFSYTHGITRHEGACQRVFHGHQGRLEIYVNQSRRLDLEKWVIQDFFNYSIHIVSPDQVEFEDEKFVHLRYQASEGHYYARIPRAKAYILPPTVASTSIETIVYCLGQKIIPSLTPGDLMEVFAYEGIGKGSVYKCTV